MDGLIDGRLHPNSSIQRSYAKRKEGGQGLVKASILDDVHEYIRKMDQSDELLSEYLRQQKVSEEKEKQGKYREILPVSGNSWTERQHRVRIMAERKQELSTKSIEAVDLFSSCL